MRILLVETSKTMSHLVCDELHHVLDLPIDWASTKSEIMDLLDQHGSHAYSLAISNLTLSDAVSGEAVDLITEYQIPTIIFTSSFDESLRTKMVSMPGVVDYVLKESHMGLRYLCQMVRRLISNKGIKTLVVDDSRAVRMHLGELMRQYQFKVFEASNGREALEVIANNPDIQLVVTDFNMPEMDGYELTKEIRKHHEREEMAVIGLSGIHDDTLSARFIKIGANDFLIKPFQPEEFFCRVTQNMDLIEKTKALMEAATRDFLTKLFNRRFFFDKGRQLLHKARLSRKPSALAILDIDHFKSVNDTFGHDVGDEVLVGVSHILQDQSRPQDLVARMGGEEFCILMCDMSPEDAVQQLERTRQAIANTHYDSLGKRGFVTSSFGCVVDCGADLEDLVGKADKRLYEAKKTGRNRVIMDSLD